MGQTKSYNQESYLQDMFLVCEYIHFRGNSEAAFNRARNKHIHVYEKLSAGLSWNLDCHGTAFLLFLLSPFSLAFRSLKI